MDSGCMVVPVLPDKVGVFAKEAPDHMRAVLPEYEESRRRAAVTRESVYHMATPMGDLGLIYAETDRSLSDMMATFIGSDLGVDTYLIDQWREIFGIDLRGGPPADPPERIWNYVDASAPRAKGLAFAAPVPPGKTDELVAFFIEAAARGDELKAARGKQGISRDQAWLQHTPMGDFACIYLEGPNPAGGNEIFAASKDPYDVWFKERAGAIFGLDFNQPLPPIVTIWDWSAEGGLAS